MIEHKLGRLIPSDWSHVDKYPFQRLGLADTQSVEKTLRVPPLIKYYDQGDTNACVGYSSSWMMSIYNSYLSKKERVQDKNGKLISIKYDALWLYRRACTIDGDPYNDPPNDLGAYIVSAMQVLWTEGHVRVLDSGKKDVVDQDDGINSFYWCVTVDQIRTAISLDRPIVFGINWYEDFGGPERIGNDWWIGRQENNLGVSRGGHAICCYAASDKREAFKLRNSWGTIYPSAWIPYSLVEKLIQQQGEFCVAIDNPKST